MNKDEFDFGTHVSSVAEIADFATNPNLTNTTTVDLSRMAYSADYKSRFSRANRLRKAGDTLGAVRVLRGLIADFPKKAAAYLVIGDILRDEGKLPAAVAAFRVATRRFPKLEIASLGLFHTLWQQSRTDAAFEEMKRFQSVSFSRDYEEIVNEILQKV